MTRDIGLIVVFGVLVLVAAVLAVAEVALLRAPRVRVEVEVERGNRRARPLLRLLDRLPLVLNTILLVVLFVQVSAAAISGFLAQQWFGGLAVTIATVLVTILLFVYSEAIPKTLALRDPMRSALWVARPVVALVRVARPLTALLLRAADAQTPGVGATAESAYSEEELRLLMEEAAAAGSIEPEDAELVNRSFEFGDMVVGDVLVPREAVVAVADSTSPARALEVAMDAGHRRLPAYRGDLDSISGVVRLRDLAAAVRAGEPTTIGPLARPTLLVGVREPLADVLAHMQATGLRFAVVTDPEGRTEGIVTIEDIVAELVGDIDDPD